MKLSPHLAVALALGMSATMVMPVAAQSQSGRRDRAETNSNQYDKAQQRGQQQNQRRDQSRDSEGHHEYEDDWRESHQQSSQDRTDRRASNQSQRRNLELDLEGWVNIATDYDHDGRYDTIETIYLYDLERARQQSQARSRQKHRDGQFANSQRSQQMLQVRGEIQSLERKQMMDSNQKNVVAKLKDEQQRIATVCLGPGSKVKQLQLSEGDTIQAHGQRARIDGRPVLMAQKVKANGQTIQNQMNRQQQRLKRLKGEVVSTRKANFDGRDGQYLVARVNTDEQGTQQINLGPAKKLSELNISEGTEVRVLAREGRINNRPAMIAEVVRANNHSVDVRGATRRTLKPQLPEDQHNASSHDQSSDQKSVSQPQKSKEQDSAVTVTSDDDSSDSDR